MFLPSTLAIFGGILLIVWMLTPRDLAEPSVWFVIGVVSGVGGALVAVLNYIVAAFRDRDRPPRS